MDGLRERGEDRQSRGPEARRGGYDSGMNDSDPKTHPDWNAGQVSGPYAASNPSSADDTIRTSRGTRRHFSAARGVSAPRRGNRRAVANPAPPSAARCAVPGKLRVDVLGWYDVSRAGRD